MIRLLVVFSVVGGLSMAGASLLLGVEYWKIVLVVALGQISGFAFASLRAEPTESDFQKLVAKARNWRTRGMFTDAEWGAVCAVLYVADASAVTDLDRQWAIKMLDKERTAPAS